MKRYFLPTLLLVFPLSPSAEAGPCAYFKKHSKALYKVYCGNGDAGGSARPAGASSTFTSSFNISSAALPTDPTDYGLETIVSVLRSPSTDAETRWTPSFALIKGFKKFGAGVSTSAANTFYSNDVLERAVGDPEIRDLAPRETARGKLSHLNLGTSFALWSPEKGAPGHARRFRSVQ